MREEHRTAAIARRRLDEDQPSSSEVVRVSHLSPEGGRKTYSFTERFLIGSHPEADLRIANRGVSRRHAEVFRDDGQWWVRDLGSTNGTSLNGEDISLAPLTPNSVVSIVPGGAPLYLELEGAPRLDSEARDQEPDPESVTAAFRRYFDSSASDNEPMTERTRLLRQAAQRARKKHAKGYRIAVGGLLLILVGSVALIFHQQRRLAEVHELAIDLFYEMRNFELEMAGLEDAARAASGSLPLASEVTRELDALEQRYEELLDELGLYEGMSEEDRLILRLARVFGECELTMPENFADEVKRYIEDWRRSNRLARAMGTLSEQGVAPTVFENMLAEHLPPQFLYLSLQESDFDPRAIGPKTRFGIAKGAWQFIPDTALSFGLRLGPLVELRQYDPADERFEFDKASAAAARYLRYLYTTDAQASGLLVLAAYNWGQTNVRRIIRQMPANPRERNFWRLLQHQEIPQETYDYVFRIFSAAVISEDPALFGFDFENPFGELEVAD